MIPDYANLDKKVITPEYIDAKEIKTGKNRGNKFLSIGQDKVYYNVWDAKLFKFFEKGIPVECVVKEGEKGFNASIVEARYKATSESVSKSPDWEEIRKDKKESISWMNAKNNTSQLISACLIACKGDLDLYERLKERALMDFDNLVERINTVVEFPEKVSEEVDKELSSSNGSGKDGSKV